MMVLTHCIYGQIELNGTLTNANTSEALIGATITEKGTNNGTISDIDGNWSLTVPSAQTVLVLNYIGFQTKEVIAGNGQKKLELTMLENGEILEDIVITALGLERSTAKLGYNVQQLDNEEIAEVQSVNLVQNLAGKLAGVTVTQGGTGIGSTSKITIRGESSFTNNNPLFVVDGTPVNNNSILNFTNEAAAGFQEVDFGNGAMDINTDDIQSLSVLKGPSAAALYGTRASNGVILITTKRGNTSDGIGVSFSTGVSVETPFQLPEFQNRYGQGNSGQFEFVDGLGGGINDNITYSWGPELDQGALIPQFDSPVTLANGQTVRGGDVAVHGGAPIPGTPFVSHENNLSDFYRTGSTLTNHLALSGGNEKGSYRVALSNLQNESIIPGTNLDRSAIISRLSFDLTDKWKINSTLNYTRSSSDNRPSSGYGSENINYSLVAWGPRSLDTEVLQDYWQPGLEGLQQYSFNYTFFDNPYFILKENTNSFVRDRIFGNISSQYQFSDELSIRLTTGIDNSDEDRRFKRNYSTNRFRNGAYAEHAVGYREINTELLANYKTQVSDFNFDISAGTNRLDQSADTRQLQTVSLAQPGIFSLSNAASPIEAFSFESAKRINSVFGLAKVGYKDYLFLELTGRNDWSSALATPTSSDNTSFFYPSISAGWIVSKLFDLPSSISFATLRASIAQVGNDTSPYQTTAVFEAQTAYNSQPTFSAQDLIANNNLAPEKSTSIELGTDIRLLDDRIGIDLTYYNSLTTNQILALPTAISSGYTQRVINGGEIRSKGIEALLNVRVINNENLNWNTSFNFSRNITTIESLPDEIEGRLTLSYSRVYDNVNQTVWHQVDEGGRVGDLYGTGYKKNEAGQFVIGDDGRYIVDNNLRKLGNYNPDFVLGWSNSVSYKNWSLSALLDWRQGGVLVSRTQALAGVGGQLLETVDRPESGIVADGVVNTGTEENPNYVANTQSINAETYYRQFYDRNHEENNTYDASYLKIRELSLSYGMKVLKKYSEGGKNLRITLTGRNLFAFSEIPHFDPEQIAIQGNNFISGVEDMSYATSRSIGIKLNIQL